MCPQPGRAPRAARSPRRPRRRPVDRPRCRRAVTSTIPVWVRLSCLPPCQRRTDAVASPSARSRRSRLSSSRAASRSGSPNGSAGWESTDRALCQCPGCLAVLAEQGQGGGRTHQLARLARPLCRFPRPPPRVDRPVPLAVRAPERQTHAALFGQLSSAPMSRLVSTGVRSGEAYPSGAREPGWPAVVVSGGRSVGGAPSPRCGPPRARLSACP